MLIPTSTELVGCHASIDRSAVARAGCSDGNPVTRTGGKIGPGGYKSRSEPQHRATIEMVRAGLDRGTIVSILTNPNFGISASVLEKKDPEYAERQIDGLSKSTGPAWDTFQNGKIRSSLKSQLAIELLKIRCMYDNFKYRMYIEGLVVQEFSGEITDNIAARISDIILHRFGFDPGREHTRDALHQLALQNTFNPMTDYFDSLAWDGVPRLDKMLIDYFGAEDTPFNRAVSAKFLIAAVRRARHPGTKFDFVVVLEGPQGGGKSSALVILAGRENFSDQDILLLDQRAQAEALEGVLIYEISELGGLNKVEMSRVKAFLSRTEDRARPAYGRFREDRPRTAIFVGTTNDDTYLRDTTGNRRFWPVKVGTIDLVRLEEDRDQLWAEAAHREAQGEAIELPATLYAASSRASGKPPRTRAVAGQAHTFHMRRGGGRCTKGFERISP